MIDPIDPDFLESDIPALQEAISHRLVYSIGKDPLTATDWDWLQALSYAVRDRLIERWMETHRSYYRTDAKRIYYLSLEFLIGRTLTNSLMNLGFMDACDQALRRLGLDLDSLRPLEPDAALGNGGLGRLAACILDSMATLDLPGGGYGIRYEYGMFRQSIEHGNQMEHPDNWLAKGNPWEFPRPEVTYKVRFGGHVAVGMRTDGSRAFHWMGGEEVLAQAYDTPVPGYKTDTVNNLRLWSAKAMREFDLQVFNQGEYVKAVEERALSENISKVLYPADNSYENQKLRLKQQYFFVSASLQDILRRFLAHHTDLMDLPNRVAIQLNDTHPTIAIPELMRLLLDEHEMDWQPAWNTVVETFSYTNHTLLPEALETWPVELMARLLPRHMELIYEINRRFLMSVGHHYPDDHDIRRRLSIIGEEGQKHVRMAHLAIIGCHTVNGVSALHTDLLKGTVFADFNRFFPGRFVNVTNGITPRRWLNQANRPLSHLITEAIGDGWQKELDRLTQLVPLAEDAQFRERFGEAKRANKVRLTELIRHHMGQIVDPESLFDVQIKRIHEYKRQLLNLIRVVCFYNRLCEGDCERIAPRVVLIGGKAAPGYATAKQIIRLVADIGEVVNQDPVMGGRLKLLFIPNYDVSTAADIIPAADLSQQISTAGMEASGTGNMKLSLNGALTIGTLDGANIEIRDRVGQENIFTFGLTTNEVRATRAAGYQPGRIYEENKELKRALDQIGNGFFSPENPRRYRGLVDSLLQDDRFMLLADFQSYMDASLDADELYADPDDWNRKAILNTAAMGFFSSDRTVRQYAERIWRVRPM